MNEAPPPLPARRSSWWERNWIWVAALGGVAGVLVFAGLFKFIQHTLKTSAPYQRAVAIAQASPAVTTALGSPVKEGYWALGNISVNVNGSGRADLSIPVNGPKGGGTVLVNATRKDGTWQVDMVVFRNTDERRDLVDLLEELKGKTPR